MRKTITFDLSASSIDLAIRELENFKKDLIKRCNTLIETLTTLGVTIAKEYVVTLGAVYTGELLGSITGYFSLENRTGIIRAGAWYAIYVEYGTGIVGAGNPHPDPWAYDVNNHGEEGWLFTGRDGLIYRTRGQPAHPFMYNTEKSLEEICGRVASEVFGR